MWARLRAFDISLTILKKAIEIAEHAGAPVQAGHAALTLIEEHGTAWRMSTEDVAGYYQRATEHLKDTQDKDTQDADDVKRLIACSRITLRRSYAQVNEPGFTFEGAIHDLEARLISQALQLEAGNVTRAAKRLGLKPPSPRQHALHPAPRSLSQAHSAREAVQEHCQKIKRISVLASTSTSRFISVFRPS